MYPSGGAHRWHRSARHARHVTLAHTSVAGFGCSVRPHVVAASYPARPNVVAWWIGSRDVVEPGLMFSPTV